MRRRIVLPFDADRFAVTSVMDRPGEWMQRFAQHIDAAARVDDLMILQASDDDEHDYGIANAAVIAQARLVASSVAPVGALYAFAVWDGVPNPSVDATAAFIALAVKANFSVVEIPTR